MADPQVAFGTIHAGRSAHPTCSQHVAHASTAVAPLTETIATVLPAAREAVGTSRPRRTSSLSAAWAQFRAIERKLSNSIWGDAIGCISLVIFAVSALFIAWGLQ